MTAQAQGIDRHASEIKLELFRQIDRLSYEELVELAAQFGLDIDLEEAEEEDVEITSEELAEVVSFEPYDGPTTFQGDLDEGYTKKYADEESEQEAHTWIEGTINFDEINRL